VYKRLSFFVYFVISICLANTSYANQVQNISCPNLNVDSQQTVEIDYNEGFVNCFVLPQVTANAPLVIVGQSGDKVTSRVRLYNLGTTTSHKFFDQNSNSTGEFGQEIITTASSPIIRISPTNRLNYNKRLAVSLMEYQGTYILFYDLVATDWVNWSGGNCNGTNCSVQKAPPTITSSGYYLNNSSSSCSPDEEIPNGPSNHDFNKHLRSIFRLSATIDALSPTALQSDIIKHGYMWNTFRNGRVNDLKNNSAYPGSSADYGNAWFGAVMAAMGYPESYALYAGAVYQEMQDTGQHPMDLSFQQWVNIFTNPQDNSEDPEMISRGHRYANGPFLQDMNNNVSNSCTGDSTGSSASSSASAGGGWSTSGGGVSFVGSSCIGACGGHGNPNTTVTDLTEEEATGTTTG
jgi:uncharacterized membrane protein YgcG